MSRVSLEERVKEMERQVEALLAGRAKSAQPKDWRTTRGAFTDDPLMKRVFAEGRKIRRADKSPGGPKNGSRRRKHG